MNPRTTVIIVTWNGRTHLDGLVPALLAQEAPGGFEVLVVDNDSRDGTPDVIAEIASRDRRVRLIRNPTNEGSPQPTIAPPMRREASLS